MEMRHFRPGALRYDRAAAIYAVAGDQPFTWQDLAQNGVDLSPGNLTALRNDGVLTHPPSGDGGQRRKRQFRGTPRDWVLTPRAILGIQTHAAREAAS